MVHKAEASIVIRTDEKGSVLLYRLLGKLFDAVSKRPVKVHFFTEVGNYNRHIVEEIQHLFQITYANTSLPTVIICVDERKLLLTTKPRSTLFNLYFFSMKKEAEDKAIFLSLNTLCRRNGHHIKRDLTRSIVRGVDRVLLG